MATTAHHAAAQHDAAGTAAAGMPHADAPRSGEAAATVVVPREFGGGSSAERFWLRAANLPLGMCLVGATSADGGVGRSTIVAALGGVLALAATGPVLAVDTTSRPWSGLTARTGRGAHTVWDAVQAQQTGPAWQGFAPAVQWTRRGPTGLHTLVAEPQRSAGRRPPVFTETVQVISALGPHTSAVLAELPPADVRPVWQYLQIVTCPLLVARASVDGVRHALHLLSQLRAAGLDAVADRTVLAVVAGVPKPSRDVRAACHQAAGKVAALVPVPWDEHLARPEPLDVRRCRRITRRALVELAAACLPPAPASPAGGHQPMPATAHSGASGTPTPSEVRS